MSNIQKRLEFFDRFIKNYHLSKDGVNINIRCPFCKDSNKNKRKMVVHLEKCFFHCWVCDKKGSNIRYLLSKINKRAADSCENIFKSYNKKFSLFNIEEEENIEPVFLPEGFKFFIDDFSLTNPDIRDVFMYAKKRGINKHKLCMLRAGYSNSSTLSRFLILPSYDRNGSLNYYVSRNIDADTANSFKYKNATIPKSRIIFNEINIDWSIPLTIVEGPLDLLKTNDNATCLLGSALTEDMLLFQQIVRSKTDIKLALDSDVYSKSIKIAKLLSQYDINVDILDTRGAEDVGDMTHEKFNNILSKSQKFNNSDSLLAKIRSL
jgi:hypothetical protein